MHALGCGPLTYGAIMYTANVLGLRKKRNESYDVFYVRTDIHNGWDEMVARHGLADNVQRTTYRQAQFVGLGSINPRAADALQGDVRSFNDMVTVEQQFRLEIPPPRVNLTKRCNEFLKEVGPNISVGFEAMSFEINKQMLLEAKAFPGGYEDEDEGEGEDEDDGMLCPMALTDTGDDSDDDDDEDFVLCYEKEADIAREDELYEEYMQQYFAGQDKGEEELERVDADAAANGVRFHYLSQAGIDPADSGKIKATMAECWRALSLNISAGSSDKKKPTTVEFTHHNTSVPGTLSLVPMVNYDDPVAGDEGPDCRRATKNAETIFNELHPILVESNRDDGMTEEDIRALCDDCANLLHTIDAIYSKFLKWYMEWDDEAKEAASELKDLIKSALKQARALGISITPKWHLLEDHILDQHIWLVKNGWGGIIWLDESFVERAHQEGVKEDRRTQGIKGYEAQQTAQLKAEERASNPSVVANRERSTREIRQRKRARTEAKAQEAAVKREEMVMLARNDGNQDADMDEPDEVVA